MTCYDDSKSVKMECHASLQEGEDTHPPVPLDQRRTVGVGAGFQGTTSKFGLFVVVGIVAAVLVN